MFKKQLVSIYPLLNEKKYEKEIHEYILNEYENIKNKMTKSIKNLKPIKINSIGLKQLGNTCYFVSLMQVLIHTNILTNYILSYKYDELNKIIYNFFYKYQNKLNISLNSSNKEYETFYDNFYIGRKFSQQDSTEFLNYKIFPIFGKLFDIRSKEFIKKMNEVDSKFKEFTLKDFRLNVALCYTGKYDNYSIIEYLFSGFLQSDLILTYDHSGKQFKKVKSKIENFNSLDLPLENISHEMNLEKLIENYQSCNNEFKSEDNKKDIKLKFNGNNLDLGDNGVSYKNFGSNLGYTNQNIDKKLSLYILPNILVISFKRFQYNNNGSRIKKDNKIKISESFEITDSNNKKHKYYVYGIIYHSGSLNGGHYWCYIRNNIFDPISNYTEYNDETVRNNIPYSEIYKSNKFIYVMFSYKEEFAKKYRHLI